MTTTGKTAAQGPTEQEIRLALAQRLALYYHVGDLASIWAELSRHDGPSGARVALATYEAIEDIYGRIEAIHFQRWIEAGK